eukprot:NODE_131_length_2044_cov_132.546867_g100_i0.p1 GENE.NODE_131_length_2044_cov_132.546867_g100_i0~~NODE_131_length_2044_cov_132.546867_g100_i0.p1  ORF type:complete len:610 (-),score=239.42 NODE_131_length_2044_cov_132.546867_g100_i0:159-1988(-)
MERIREAISNLKDRPQSLLVPDEQIATSLRSSMIALCKAARLPITVDNMDAEQIWAQLVPHNENAFGSQPLLSSSTIEDHGGPSEEADSASSIKSDNSVVGHREVDEGDDEEEDDDDDDNDDHDEDEEADEEDDDEAEAALEAELDKLGASKGGFRLGQAGSRGKKKKVQDDSGMELDLLESDEGGEDDAEEEGEEDEEDEEALMDEMFGAGNYDPDELGEDEEAEQEMDEEEEDLGDDLEDEEPTSKGPGSKRKRARFADEEEGHLDGEGPAPAKRIDADVATPFEKERLKVERMIAKLEKESVNPRHWSLMGEVSAKSRPMNSLLEVDVDFDHVAKPKPVVTEEFTEKLEEMIKRRVAEGRFDDVERKVKLTTAADALLKPTVESMEDPRKRVGLADLYEKEFLEKKKVEAAEGGGEQRATELTALDKQEIEVLEAWRKLSYMLDSLSNLHFTPKVANLKEAEVVHKKDVAAIAMEEATPVAVSNATLLAPQDLFRPPTGKHADKSAAELQREDRRAIRRSKKEEGKAKERRIHTQHKNKELLAKQTTGLADKKDAALGAVEDAAAKGKPLAVKIKGAKREKLRPGREKNQSVTDLMGIRLKHPKKK